MGQHSRRTVLAMGAGAVGLSTGYLSFNVADEPARDIPYFTSPGLADSDYEVDITIFTTPPLHPTASPNEYTRTDVIADALHHALPTLSSEEFTVTADISVAPHPVPTKFSRMTDYPTSMDAFTDYVMDEVDSDVRGSDSNLLITDAAADGLLGHGQIPQSIYSNDCDSRQSVMGHGVDINPNIREAATSLRTGTVGARLNTAVHEIGHTLGLRHNMGDAWRDSEEPRRIIVTPMLSSYLYSDKDNGVHGSNYYQSDLPDVASDDDVYLTFTPYFNPDISPADLIIGDAVEPVCHISGAASALLPDD